uniref:protein-serine/threonine phosphatase n=1 Tax=Geotrypetes seraphini TaxID=260995 RepID=A0A6P8SGH7_GEOSA|nr:protein phosphatase 1K, mitochondrial-like [Geotrypetes seraphini]XP_033817477.1 protein phosphatase 1K, mitochondrial-like [Geotrypetes seraphini]XP_033817487.1 protein phosphatase 1K, mitochondrial-like [Geotrypetes seraphini]XP_033817497.1 protein phosphatase 1K, mitochondrial-like [Geotrypetes seraphini]XP_033817504.1 protein phosphatase 1K, mitochondrial-like [Geotrypetes seraphini]
MSTAALIHLARRSGHHVRRQALLTSRLVQEDTRVTPVCHTTTTECRASRFDQDGSGRPSTWDSFGIWDNRIDEPILIPPSIKYGKPIPKISLSKVGCATQIGKRKENEDRLNFAVLKGDILYFAVYDGHGGVAAADFCNKFMDKYIEEMLAQEQNLEKVLIKAFLEIDKAFAGHMRTSANATSMNSGTTATVGLLRDGIELVVASVGDSRAILCRKGKAQKLTIDHTPERKDEKERIKKCGGFIAWNSLGQPNVNGRLAMTRSIGDLDLKGTGVIAEPETKRIQLHLADDAFLVLTTDGINFIVNSQEICDIITQCHDPTEAAQVLTEQALQYGTEDNSTVIIVPFAAWGKHKNSEVSFSFSRSFASSGRWA